MHNPLIQLHRKANAETQPYGDIEIVSTFGEMPAEYSAVHKRCGMMDLPQRSFIELTGPDRLTFLNNLISNQVFDKQTKSGLSAGQGVYAFLLNAKSGRIITDLNVLELGERTLLELDRRLADAVAAALEKYRFAEQVKISSRSDQFHEIALHGPTAAAVLKDAGADVDELTSPMVSKAAKLFDVDVTIWRDDPTGVPAYILILPAESAQKIWSELLTGFTGADAFTRRLRPIGWAAFNAVRIEAGRPLFGIDFDESILPHETGPLLNRAVSFTKGCYPGQEIVARMHARGGAARSIVGIRMTTDHLPIAGTKIYDDAGNEIGGVTSSTMSPILSNAALCIALVKRPHFTIGRTLTIPAEGQMRQGSVVELPFFPEKGK